jgi:hypothetical protein
MINTTVKNYLTAHAMSDELLKTPKELVIANPYGKLIITNPCEVSYYKPIQFLITNLSV